MVFFGGQPIFFQIYFSVLAFKTIDKQMLFWSVFLKTLKKPVINHQKRRKWRFWWSLTFFVRFQKYRPKEFQKNFKFVFLRLFFNENQSSMPIFIKKY